VNDQLVNGTIRLGDKRHYEGDAYNAKPHGAGIEYFMGKK
jgi:hypothetical protein